MWKSLYVMTTQTTDRIYSMYCPSCGGEIEDTAQFCEHCGADIGEADSGPAQEPQTETAGQGPSGQGPPPNTGGGQGQGPPQNTGGGQGQGPPPNTGGGQGQGQPPNAGGGQGQGPPNSAATNARGGGGAQGAHGQGPPPRGGGGAQGATAQAQTGQVAGGLDPNVAAALSYVLGVITGLVFFLIEEENQFVRFHASQSIVVFGALFVFNIGISIFVGVLASISGFFSLLNLLSTLVSLAGLILWVLLIYKAYNGEWYRVPVAAGIADDLM